MHIIVKIRLFKWQTIQYFVENLQNIDYHTLNYKIPQILPQYDINLPRALLTRSRKIPCLVVPGTACPVVPCTTSLVVPCTISLVVPSTTSLDVHGTTSLVGLAYYS